MTLERDTDRIAEQRVAEYLERVWRCKVNGFGQFSPIDRWLERDGNWIATAEIKVRTHASTDYPTVWLAVRKWLSLRLAAMTGLPALFVVRFADERTLFINSGAVDCTQHTIGGRSDRGLDNDREPMIDVPIADMKEVRAIGESK